MCKDDKKNIVIERCVCLNSFEMPHMNVEDTFLEIQGAIILAHAQPFNTTVLSSLSDQVQVHKWTRPCREFSHVLHHAQDHFLLKFCSPLIKATCMITKVQKAHEFCSLVRVHSCGKQASPIRLKVVLQAK